VPSWEEARRVLFGDRRRAGLVARCRDEESLISAAGEHHAYLAAYCAHIGRSRLAYTPIHVDDHCLQEFDDLRAEYEAMAAPWEERRERGLELEARRRRHLVKPDFAKALVDRWLS
jgi:hypothetical protein